MITKSDTAMTNGFLISQTVKNVLRGLASFISIQCVFLFYMIFNAVARVKFKKNPTSLFRFL